MIGIVDYGVGNLFSLVSSFAMIGAEAAVVRDADGVKQADKIILPGVGAFEDAAAKLRATGLDRVLVDEARAGKPLLGICLGMQLLFEESLEYGTHPGLGLLAGTVAPIRDVIPADYKIPHIGWNALRFTKPACPLWKYIREGDYVYFVHSYHASRCEDSTAAVTEYGGILTAAAWKKNIYGCQFHPEKSGEVGMKILRAFCEEGGAA
ncbi:MAG: imidazole glycerol phosphate synthase subunit HisH [Clostridia bacterium]|nr:imidazole glycerol phosphate synthase subunit HisH [Clostridia bacterium]MBR5365197.1 imidazole glycerol phosphate synthase subunit HisH [Clostridia bacterium]